jgi:hypothetical protein
VQSPPEENKRRKRLFLILLGLVPLGILAFRIWHSS